MATLWNNCSYGALLYSPIADQSLDTNIPIRSLVHRETASEISVVHRSRMALEVII